VAEKVDQLGPLTVAKAGDRLCLGDPAVSKRTLGPGRTDPRYSEKQLFHLRPLHRRGRDREQLGKFDRARGKLSLQLRARETNLVCPRKRGLALLARARRDEQRLTPTLHGPILRADTTGPSVNATLKPRRGQEHASMRRLVLNCA
jgi:hypothetical protein